MTFTYLWFWCLSPLIAPFGGVSTVTFVSSSTSRVPVHMLPPAISAAMAVHTFNGTEILLIAIQVSLSTALITIPRPRLPLCFLGSVNSSLVSLSIPQFSGPPWIVVCY